jgi:hypothetical protein
VDEDAVKTASFSSHTVLSHNVMVRIATCSSVGLNFDTEMINQGSVRPVPELPGTWAR